MPISVDLGIDLDMDPKPKTSSLSRMVSNAKSVFASTVLDSNRERAKSVFAPKVLDSNRERANSVFASSNKLELAANPKLAATKLESKTATKLESKSERQNNEIIILEAHSSLQEQNKGMITTNRNKPDATQLEFAMQEAQLTSKLEETEQKLREKTARIVSLTLTLKETEQKLDGKTEELARLKRLDLDESLAHIMTDSATSGGRAPSRASFVASPHNDLSPFNLDEQLLSASNLSSNLDPQVIPSRVKFVHSPREDEDSEEHLLQTCSPLKLLVPENLLQLVGSPPKPHSPPDWDTFSVHSINSSVTSILPLSVPVSPSLSESVALEVWTWLLKIGFQHYHHVFAANNLKSLAAICSLDGDDLLELGFNSAQRKLLLCEIQELSTQVLVTPQ